MAVDDLGLAEELLVLLVADVFTLDLLPALDLVQRADDAAELLLLEVDLAERVATLAKRALQAGL